MTASHSPSTAATKAFKRFGGGPRSEAKRITPIRCITDNNCNIAITARARMLPISGITENAAKALSLAVIRLTLLRKGRAQCR